MRSVYLKLTYIFLFFLSTFSVTAQEKSVFVENPQELHQAIDAAKPGEEIVMSNGSWKDVQIEFIGQGTAEQPIVLRAETKGKVSLEGKSSLKLGGEYLVVQDVIFTNGYTPNDAVIEFRIDHNTIANHCRVSNVVIKDFTQPNRSMGDLWVLFWGRHNQLDHSYLAGKSNEGPTLRVALKGNEHIKNHHKIINNHFGPRPRKGGPKAETIQIGSSGTSMAPSYVTVANNLFEECNGEVEIISNKSSFNEFRNNVFYKSEGSLVLRHGNYCVVDGNAFIGDGESAFYGGIRVINTGHLITNNYFYNLKGEEFRSPLAIMNGIPKSPLNRYNQVTDVVIAHNTWVDSPTPWHFSVGANIDKNDVLPASEIRSARPKRLLVANNLVYNTGSKSPLIMAYDEVDGINFKKNIVNPKVEVKSDQNGIAVRKFSMEQVSEHTWVPSGKQDFLTETFPGFEFDQIETDIFQQDRTEDNRIGAFARSAYEGKSFLNMKEYGPDWFQAVTEAPELKNFELHSRDAAQLQARIDNARKGAIITLRGGTFRLRAPLKITNNITLRSKEGERIKLQVTGAENIPVFELHPGANLNINNLLVAGSGQGWAFATLKAGMSKSYDLTVENSEFRNLHGILKTYKNSFADQITFVDSKFVNMSQGILLDAETDNRGDYNAEFVTILNSSFENIDDNVLSYYRGGYDESTIGGNLLITGSVFSNSGAKEETDILLKSRGIVNVEISENTFVNNSVELIALLWGEKGNVHRMNKIVNSGKFVVEKYLKQKLVY